MYEYQTNVFRENSDTNECIHKNQSHHQTMLSYTSTVSLMMILLVMTCVAPCVCDDVLHVLDSAGKQPRDVLQIR